MEDIIYIVTSGCYSDYHIEAVFKDKEKAEFYCTCHNDCEGCAILRSMLKSLR